MRGDSGVLHQPVWTFKSESTSVDSLLQTPDCQASEKRKRRLVQADNVCRKRVMHTVNSSSSGGKVPPNGGEKDPKRGLYALAASRRVMPEHFWCRLGIDLTTSRPYLEAQSFCTLRDKRSTAFSESSCANTIKI